MELCCNEIFIGIANEELLNIDGGVNWDAVGLTVTTVAGASIGATIGSAGGPIGTVAGGLIGAGISAIIYTLWD